MNDTPRATISKLPKKRFSITWCIPALALIVTVFLFTRWQLQQGPSITITFSNVHGLTSNSPIMFKGAIVGLVKDISLSQESDSIVVTARLKQSASSLAVAGSTWWIVHPDISLQGINGLDTLIGPKYIQVSPGIGEEKNTFEGSGFPQMQNGKSFTVVTDSADGIDLGAPIFYRGIEVGNIHAIDLAPNAAMVHLHFTIKHIYTPIIRTNTVFWNASGIKFEAGLTGFKLHAGPLASLVKGGISLATPNNVGAVAPDHFEFDLIEEFNESWLDWAPEIELYGEGTEK
jgi:paraquat-inducible protein B